MPPNGQKSKPVKRPRSTGESDSLYSNSSTESKIASKSKRSKPDSVDSDPGSVTDGQAPVVIAKTTEKPEEDQDKYCKMCDDGGNLLECDRCGFSYCYDELPSLQVDPKDETASPSCISVPQGYAVDPFTKFYCPECLTEHPELPLDYHINRGFRLTQRRVVNTQVVILFSYLPALEQRAKRLDSAIRSLLGGFEIVTTAVYLPVPETMHTSTWNWILGFDYPYHLVFLFMTETNPGGGWWTGEKSQTNETEWLSKLVCLYKDIAEKAVTARIFGLSCGLNLAEDHTIQAILSPLVNSHWDSIMLPTASSLLPEEFTTIFPELFGQIYYNGVSLESAVVRVWATSQRARAHTDILLIDGLSGQPSVQKYRYGSLSSRPYGVDLPAPWSFCSCASKGDNPKWKRKDGKITQLHNEFLFRYRTSCNHAHIDLAIYTGTAHIREAAGAQIIIEDYDYQACMFPLDSPDSVTMNAYLVRSC